MFRLPHCASDYKASSYYRNPALALTLLRSRVAGFQGVLCPWYAHCCAGAIGRLCFFYPSPLIPCPSQGQHGSAQGQLLGSTATIWHPQQCCWLACPCPFDVWATEMRADCMDPLLARNLTLPMRQYLTHSYVNLMLSTILLTVFYPKPASNCSLLYLLFLINFFYFYPVQYLTFLVIPQITYIPTHRPRLTHHQDLTAEHKMPRWILSWCPGRSNQTSLICPTYPQCSSEEFQNSNSWCHRSSSGKVSNY